MKILIVGMGAGLGLSTAKLFGAHGFDVIMVARTQPSLAVFQSGLAQLGITATFHTADLSDPAGFAVVAKQIVNLHPDIEILLYNASAFNPAKPSEIDIPTFLTDFNTNVTGALIALQAVLPTMRKRRRGTIFLTGGGSALNPSASLASLGIGKAGIRNLALSLTQECAEYGIGVATLTINGAIMAGTHFDPDLIAHAYWELHQKPVGEMPAEVVWE
jgi:NAD(P)-dependent dehydrogenase (short-subunit alcohol dehydrogenase family)